MANMIKINSMQDVGHLCKHYERSVEPGHYSNENIDQTRLNEDRINLAPDRSELYPKQTDYIQHMIKEIMGDKKLRKDAVRMVSWVVDAPKNLPQEKHNEFFKAAYDFLTDRYGRKSGLGEDVVVSCYIHNSESTPHIHFAFMPILKKNGKRSFCAKDVVNRDDLRSFHYDLAAYMESRGICSQKDILTGNTQRDSAGRALSVKELKNRDYQQKVSVRHNRWEHAQERTVERKVV